MFDNNPVHITANHSDPRINIISNPDPYAIFHEGMYYIYSTGHYGVNVLRSKDMENFEHMGLALEDNEWESYWAPAVIFYEGKFYMYYASKRVTETGGHHMQIAVANHPLGPFTYTGKRFDDFSIDAHVIEKNGDLYLFYTPTVEHDGKKGSMIVVDKMIDPLTPCGNPRLLLYPTFPQEMFVKDQFGEGIDGYTVEGAFYFEHEGTGFLMYSGGNFTGGDYFVNYAVCDASLPLDEAVFTKYPNNHTFHALMGKDDHCTGCGHNSLITGPKGELLVVYHGRSRIPATNPMPGDDRQLCVSEIKIEGNKLILNRRK
ncbi:MAG: glycoside hydrolase family 43 protein [Defluviitaleaceae bacterium]|nr:glycoside hydrolase family 43 protein [Defluviitaleaceae bacterium]